VKNIVSKTNIYFFLTFTLCLLSDGMKRKIYFPPFFILAFYFLADNCLAQVMFQETYRGIAYNNNSSVSPTNDGGYIMGGSTNSFGSVGYASYLIRTNSDGDTLWTKIYDDTLYDDGIYFVQQTYDGGIIAVGSPYDASHGTYNIYLIKTDGNGIILWTKKYWVTGFESASSVLQTNDGGFIISGHTAPNGFDLSAYIIRTNNIGNILWTKVFGYTTANVYCKNVLQNSDGSFVISAEIASIGIALIKTDATGNIIWTKVYAGPFYSFVQHTADGGYIISARITRLGHTDFDIALIKTDAAGDTLWTRTYGTSTYENATGIQQTNDGGYIASGDGSTGSSSDALLLKISSIGNLQWSKAYGDSSNQYSVGVHQTSDGGYILGGVSENLSATRRDFYLVKTDSNGVSGCHESSPVFAMSNTNITLISGGIIAANPMTLVSTPIFIVSTPPTQQTTLCYTVGLEEINGRENSVTIFPNPAINQFTINSKQFVIKEVEIYDVLGEKVLSKDVTAGNTDVFTINTEGLTPGIYFITVMDEKKNSVTRKIVKM
jgi:hypothetical protein